MFNNDFYLTSPKPYEAKSGVNLLELIGNHAVKLLWGRGYTLHGSDRKLIEQVFEEMRAEVFLPALEKVAFQHGHAIITLRKTLSGKIRPTVPILWGTSNVALTWEVEEELAVVWERIIFDDANFVMKTVFDRQKSVTSFYKDDGNNVLGEVIILGESTRIANSLNIPLVDHHNLGIVPVIFMPNLPQKNYMSNATGSWYPDATPSGDMLQELQQHLDKIIDNINWELEFNRTLVFMTMSPQDQEEVRKDPDKLKEKFNRFIIENRGASNIINPETGRVTAPIDIMQGKPNLSVLSEYYNYTIDRGFNFCGYNSPQGTREHGTNKTSDEVSINMQNDYLTTSLKVNIRSRQINRLIKKMLAYLGKPEGECTIEIHGMSTMEYATFNDVILNRFEKGLISRSAAISRLDKISLDEAEEMSRQVEKEQQATFQQELQLQTAKGSNSQSEKGGGK